MRRQVSACARNGAAADEPGRLDPEQDADNAADAALAQVPRVIARANLAGDLHKIGATALAATKTAAAGAASGATAQGWPSAGAAA